MKKWLLVLVCFLLSGCSSATFETLGDIPHQQVAALTPRKVQLTLPEDSVQAVWSQEGVTMYLCGDYVVYFHYLIIPMFELNSHMFYEYLLQKDLRLLS